MEPAPESSTRTSCGQLPRAPGAHDGAGPRALYVGLGGSRSSLSRGRRHRPSCRGLRCLGVQPLEGMVTEVNLALEHLLAARRVPSSRGTITIDYGYPPRSCTDPLSSRGRHHLQGTSGGTGPADRARRSGPTAPWTLPRCRWRGRARAGARWDSPRRLRFCSRWAMGERPRPSLGGS